MARSSSHGGRHIFAPFPGQREPSVSQQERLVKSRRRRSDGGECTGRRDDGETGAIDVLVAGAGYVGLATAVSLKPARPSLAVAIVDAAPEGVWKRDGRASAIAAAACRMLGSTRLLGRDRRRRRRRSPR